MPEPVTASVVSRAAEALAQAADAAGVVSAAAQALESVGVRYVLLRAEAGAQPQWLTTLPEWVAPEAYAEHLALLAYGPELEAGAEWEPVWVEDWEAEERFRCTGPYARRLGFRALTFSPVTLTTHERKRGRGLAAFCWQDAQPRSAESADLLCGVAALIASAYDATQHMQRLQELEAVPGLSRATGLPSAALMQELGPQVLAASDRRREPLACLVLRLRTGREGASEASREQRRLRTIALVLEGATRESDVVGQAAEEEFVVLLPGAAMEGAARVAHRILKALDSAGEDLSLVEGPVLGGIALANRVELSYDAAVDLASAALRQAETQGQSVLVLDGVEGGLTGWDRPLAHGPLSRLTQKADGGNGQDES